MATETVVALVSAGLSAIVAVAAIIANLRSTRATLAHERELHHRTLQWPLQSQTYIDLLSVVQQFNNALSSNDAEYFNSRMPNELASATVRLQAVGSQEVATSFDDWRRGALQYVSGEYEQSAEVMRDAVIQAHTRLIDRINRELVPG